jgi:two-component system response regulator ResD
VTASDGCAAHALLRRHCYELVVLDVMLPGIDGLSLCRWIRATSRTPVILLTARGEEADRIVGLELGADDYVTKPFSPRELVARIRTVLRRATPPPPYERQQITVGQLELDLAAREARNAGATLQLTGREFDLLAFLASNPNRVFSRDQLMTAVWGYTAARDTGTVTVHIRRLREKVELDPSNPTVLETIWGVGYRFHA